MVLTLVYICASVLHAAVGLMWKYQMQNTITVTKIHL